MKTLCDDVFKQLDLEGFAIARGVLDGTCCDALIDAVGSLGTQAAVREKSGATYAVRRICELAPAVARFAASPEVRSLVEAVLGPTARVVRSLLFDKTADANWKVPWHQDLTIAVRERRQVEGFGPWSVKADLPHVQPPAKVLEDMVTLRVHLDKCGVDNGPLRVLPKSHRMGVLDGIAITEMRRNVTEVNCTMERGDALLMRPLLLHASSPATLPGHRRVIHLEFGRGELPGGLEWAES